jgi:3-phenylpropionate/cinnamic acid dioxygenase small subunit
MTRAAAGPRPDDPRADDEESIRALVVAYAERLDAGDLDGVAALFEHGRFRSTRRGDARVGREAVRSMYAPVVIYADGTPRTKHVLGNIEVDVGASTASEATARCTFTVLQAAPGGPLHAVLVGRYHDRFVRTEGTWRFAERTVHPDLVGDLSEHMGHGRG